METEAAKCRRCLPGPAGEVRVASGIADHGTFDVAVGNPPFVRFQFVSAADRAAADALAERLGLALGRVGNLWIPVLLSALAALRSGGVFAFVLPAELLTGRCAAAVRTWLDGHADGLRLDHFEPGSFPGVLQEVVVASGRRSAAARPAEAGEATWTARLLPTRHRAALAAAGGIPRLGELARFQVSTVTGANAYFCVGEEELDRWALRPHARPLLSRLRHAPGLVCDAPDAWLVDLPAAAGAHPYVRHGEQLGLHRRYKCRVRSPWFSVPVVEAGDLLLSKRSHRAPRLVVNRCRALTTDTIYQGRTREGIDPDDLAATFHSSLTLLSAEVEGRSFGGGVLELVPSEVARLRVAHVPGARKHLPRLQRLAANGDLEALIAATDELLVAAGCLDRDVLAELADARALLSRRRLRRAEARRSAAATPPGGRRLRAEGAR